MSGPTSDVPKILIVENDPEQHELLVEMLSAHYGLSADKWQIVSVTTGADCLAQPLEEFAIILLDPNLPDVSGLDLVQRVRRRADVPVVFLTGQDTPITVGEALRCGDQDYVLKLCDYLFGIPAIIEKNLRQFRIWRENQRLQDELETMLSELRVKNIQLEESLQKLQTMAETDHLTGLANRRKVAEVAEIDFNESQRYGYDLSCCMCDLDCYKELNDSLGHQTGDQALMVTADVIRQSLRISDVAARYGGDEFVLFLPHTSVERAATVCDRIRQELIHSGSRIELLDRLLTLSVGIASLQADDPSCADDLLSMADRAMYAAKGRGKNQTIVFGNLAEIHP